MKITVKAPGSCGELVQGKVNGIDFLVTCPINLYSEVSVIKKEDNSSTLAPKMQLAMEKTLSYLKINPISLYIKTSTQMPLGKGMASSSADISAICQSIALSFGKKLTPHQIADIALSIEPTDGIFYPGITMFDHRYGKVRHSLGDPPPITVVIFDIGGEIDTLLFNQRQDLDYLNQEKEKQVSEALELVVEGIKQKDIYKIGRGATLSALANQKILNKPPLEELIDTAMQVGAVGVNVAHSGTVAGVLFPNKTSKPHDDFLEKLQKISNITYLNTVKLISGGLMAKRGDSHEWEKCI